MATITVFPSLIRIAETSNLYLQKVLFAFLLGPHKIAMDCNGIIVERYKEASHSNLIFMWLKMMSDIDGFETVRIDIKHEQTDEERCLKLCRATNGLHLAFVNSLQEIDTPLTANNSVVVENEEVILIDKDEAVVEMSKPNIKILLQNSIIANGPVTNSNNNNINKYDE